MDSSILDLKEALRLLVDDARGTGGVIDGNCDGTIEAADQHARHINMIFNNVNSSLEEGWKTTSNLLYKLYNLITDKFGEMYNDISKFTDETYQAELSARKAVDTANEAANEILNELGLVDTTSTSTDGALYITEKTGSHVETRVDENGNEYTEIVPEYSTYKKE